MLSHRTIRHFIYGGGIFLLAVGITLNTKAGLGVSPVISIPYGLAQIGRLNLGFVTFLVYTLFVGVQLLMKKTVRRWDIWLQLPFSLVFSICLNLCSAGYDRMLGQVGGENAGLLQQLLVLGAGILLTAAGVAMMVDMKGVPNPADGLAKALGEALHRDMGLGKNLLDLSCVAVTCLAGLVLAGEVVGIGLGTLVAVIGVGRCIAGFQLLFRDRLCRAAGFLEKTGKG